MYLSYLILFMDGEVGEENFDHSFFSFFFALLDEDGDGDGA